MRSTFTYISTWGLSTGGLSTGGYALLLSVAIQLVTMPDAKAQKAIAQNDTVKALEKKKEKQRATSKKTLIIQSQVKGSQEQPNVIYIMPWQGIENPITIDGNKRQIVLPKLSPINPKVFKQQVARFYDKKDHHKKNTNKK